MSILPPQIGSFFGGPDRGDGLRLVLEYEDGLIFNNFRVGKGFEGYTDVVQGAFVFGILDVLIWYAILIATGKVCMTRKAETEYVKPVRCNVTYRAEARFLRVDGDDFYASALVLDETGEVCTRLTTVFRETRAMKHEEFLRQFDVSVASPDIREIFLNYRDSTGSDR